MGAPPLVEAHLNHIDQAGVKCSNRAQKLLRDLGFLLMEHVLDGRGALIDWAEAQLRGALPMCKRVFNELCANLRLAPVFPASSANKDLYVESVEGTKLV